MKRGASHIFGPVPSRRLGLSLGIDLIPHKTCSYDCIYCQVGRTTDRRIHPQSFYSLERIISEAREKIPGSKAQSITLAGSGEPTLSKDLQTIVRAVKEMTDIPVALLTNGSLFWMKQVREASLLCDIILPTLSAGREETFRHLHRPHPEITLKKVIEGLERLRDEYDGKMFLEVMLVRGVNDSDQEVETLREKLEEVAPNKVQINTVVRPPSEPATGAVSPQRLQEIRSLLGPRAEIIVPTPLKDLGTGHSTRKALVEMIRRRPLSTRDIQKITGQSLERIQDLIADLVANGLIEEQIHHGTIYYKAT